MHYAPAPELLEAGEDVDGWDVEVLRGHADGHIVLHRDGVLIAGDTILARISPVVGLYPNSRPDPLGDYLETLARIEDARAPGRVCRSRAEHRGPGRAGRASSASITASESTARRRRSRGSR